MPAHYKRRSAGRKRRFYRPLWLGGEVPGGEPGDRLGLELELVAEALVHVVQMAGAVEDPNVFLPGGQLLLENRERLLVALGNDCLTLFAAKADHQAFHFGKLLGKDDL